MLTVYVPVLGKHTSIDLRSAIVGSPEGDRIRIDFEGNRYRASNIKTVEDKLMVAAGRHVSRYPTIARMWVAEDTLIEVGSYDPDTRRVQVSRNDLWKAWFDE